MLRRGLIGWEKDDFNDKEVIINRVIETDKTVYLISFDGFNTLLFKLENETWRKQNIPSSVYGINDIKKSGNNYFAIASNDIGESKSIAFGLKKNSMIYLIAGVGIGILGILIFQILIFNYLLVINKDTGIWQIIIGAGGRFGVLVFIEYIALFFLKQYRVNMEEFRYYECITREREALLVSYASAVINKDDKELSKSLQSILIKENNQELTKINTDETTNPLSSEQTHLLTSILDKVMDVLTTIKKP